MHSYLLHHISVQLTRLQQYPYLVHALLTMQSVHQYKFLILCQIGGHVLIFQIRRFNCRCGKSCVDYGFDDGHIWYTWGLSNFFVMSNRCCGHRYCRYKWSFESYTIYLTATFNIINLLTHSFYGAFDATHATPISKRETYLCWGQVGIH